VRLHDRLFIAAVCLAGLSIMVISAGANQRERAKLVVEMPVDDGVLASDQGRLERLARALPKRRPEAPEGARDVLAGCRWILPPPPRDPVQPVDSHAVAAKHAGLRLARKMSSVSLRGRRAARGGEGSGGEAPDVVMIVLDTFRADRLAAYGGAGGIAPNLDAFASSATVFPRMVSTGAWTLPSHGSLFTGLFPIEHGARGSPAAAPTRAYRLTSDAPTLAQRLHDAGWLTVGAAANRAFLDRTWGLSRGFDVWLCEDLAPRGGLTYIQGDRIALLGAAAFEHRDPDVPLFLFLNFMDTHTPWIPREGFTARPERIDPLLLQRGGTWQERGYWGDSRRAVLSGRRPATPAERATWAEAYDAEVRYLDSWFGHLMGALEEHGVGEEDYIIVLSDHGEYLGEHGLLEHSKDVFEEVLRVPLMIRGPGFGPGVDRRPAQTHDVPELLLEALGLKPLGAERLRPVGEDPLQVSELYWARHRELRDSRIAARFNRIRRAFRDGDHKLVLSSDDANEAYDLAADPAEATSVFARAQWVAPLRAMGEAWLSDREASEGEGVELDSEQEDRLRALGYIE